MRDPVTPEQLGAAMAAYGAAKEAADVHRTADKLRALWPGLKLRPHHAGGSLWFEVSPGVGAISFELNAYRKRAHDPELLRLACVALNALAADKAGEKSEAERPRVEAYVIADGRAAAFWPLDMGASQAVAVALASNHCAKLNGAGPPIYGVRVIGAPDVIVPGEFDRAQAAGYDVEPEPFKPGWLARTPDGDEVGGMLTTYDTERAAWEACDRHRMFGDAGPAPAMANEGPTA